MAYLDIDLPVAAAVVAGVGGLVVYTMLRSVKKFLPTTDFFPLPLVRKEVLSHDTVRFTFGLPDKDMLLGLPIGQHLSLKFTNAEGKAVQRSYTPVSTTDTKGEVSLVIKVYKPNPPKFPNGGQMSQHLDSLKIGDTILVKGPKGHMDFTPSGNFTVKPLGKPLSKRSTQQITMIAGGTGITPMYQLLQTIFLETGNRNGLKVKLIYANQTENDILLRTELDNLAEQFPNHFSVWYTVDRSVTDGWKYDTGFINLDMIQKHGSFGPNQQFFLCGPPPMIKFACLPNLTEMGFTDSNWVVF